MDDIEILIVDDRRENILAFEAVLESIDARVLSATSGKQALKLSLDHDFAVIIMDVQMPEIDGIETVRLMKGVKKTRKTPIIFVTAINPDQEFIKKGYEAGAVDYLFKPVNSHVLASKVKIFVELYRQKITLEKEITERISAQKKTSKIMATLKDSVQELNQFAYVVSHDLKAPLRTVGLLTEMLASDYGSKIGQEGREYMKLVVNATHRSQMLIDGVLEYSKAGRAGELLVSQNINKLIDNILKTLIIPDQIKISVNREMPEVVCNDVQMTQVFQNLITNAVKFIDKPDGAINIGFFDTKDFHRFYVEDNGSGIDEKYVTKIFNIFETLGCNDRTDSTGVGLSIVKKIIEKWGGSVWVESKIKKGSTFFFTVPKKSSVESGHYAED